MVDVDSRVYRQIRSCRICGNTSLVPILDLGVQSLTGVFPRTRDEQVTRGPLELVKCLEDGRSCGLIQLRHSYRLSEMYGLNYGYRSGLNQSMVQHLRQVVERIPIELKPGDVVLDIGSNDGTLLKFYSDKLVRLGIDPTGTKFKHFYPSNIQLAETFFSSQTFNSFGTDKAKVITSIAMFYDLESPMEFIDQIYNVLADDGIWIFEQSYLPTMLKTNSYDTVVHEHLEFYCLKQIKWMTDRAGLKIIDVTLNDVNGGSFAVTVAKKDSPYQEATGKIAMMLHEEWWAGVQGLQAYKEFRLRVMNHSTALIDFIENVHAKGEKILGYGASTKGNVVLQYCGITEHGIPAIADVNEDKVGCFTPGSLIPIVSEQTARDIKPDYFLVLPWHFKKGIVEREQEFLAGGGRLVFALPELEVVSE